VYRLISYTPEHGLEEDLKQRTVLEPNAEQLDVAMEQPIKIIPESSMAQSLFKQNLCKDVLLPPQLSMEEVALQGLKPMMQDTDMESSKESTEKVTLRDPAQLKQDPDAEAPPPAPKVGDQFRELCNQDDLFIKENQLWCIATVVSVKQNRGAGYTLKLEYSDKTTADLQYPDDDLEFIIPKEASSASSIYNVAGAKEDSSAFAYDSNPSSLTIGDYVECYYQNGGAHGRWWPGRIASVKSDGKRCDVAYFDGEVRIMRLVIENWLSSNASLTIVLATTQSSTS